MCVVEKDPLPQSTALTGAIDYALRQAPLNNIRNETR